LGRTFEKLLKTFYWSTKAEGGVSPFNLCEADVRIPKPRFSTKPLLWKERFFKRHPGRLRPCRDRAFFLQETGVIDPL